MLSSRRTFIQSLSATAAAASLTGCDEFANPITQLLNPAPPRNFTPTASPHIDTPTHLLNRLTFGPKPGDYQALKTLGPQAFIQQQLNPQSIPDSLADYHTMSIESLPLPTPELYEFNEDRLLADLTQYKLLRATYSNRQLYEVMVDFWTDHFNIVSEKADCRWLKAADDRDVIRKHTLGSFPDLLRASALSPAMLIYLDGHDNKVTKKTDRPNENYARELLELHTMGVNSGYTQEDIMNLARCLSGWTYKNKPLSFHATEVKFNKYRHDDGAKTLLGQHIPPGGGAEDLTTALNILTNHPATANYLATKLCRRFIADPPPPAAVQTVAQAFTDSKGDIPKTLTALFETDDFLNNPAYRANLFKRPQRFIISALRATDAQTNAAKPITQLLARMGHASFQYPTPDGYPIEQQPWLGTLLWRWKFALALQRKQIKGTSINPKQLLKKFTSTEQLAAHFLGRTPNALEEQLLAQTTEPLALLTSTPAFQLH